MNARSQIRMLPDRRRLHMQDGPIDLIVQAFGPNPEIQIAYQAASARFVTVLDELCAELQELRQPSGKIGQAVRGTVSQRMVRAVAPYGRSTFITPMAAVAGAVAEEILQAMTASAKLAKAYVNDGGDIALYMGNGEEFSIGLVERPDQPSLFGTFRIRASHPVRGIATSGWRGRSFSLGIADAVTVLARTAAEADAAATIVANAVELPGSDKVGRVPACELAPDTDLGDRLVTQSVGQLDAHEIAQALASGISVARQLLAKGLIFATALHLQGETRIVGPESEFPIRQSSAERRRLVHA